VPWNVVGRKGDFRDAPWELYHIEDDFSEADDLAAKNPQKLKQLQALFLQEAKKYNVFPLDLRFSERADPRNRAAGELPTRWTYYGNNVRLPEPIGPNIYPNSHTVTAELMIPDSGAEDVIAATGGLNGGWSIYVQNGKLTYRYNLADFEHYTVQARDPLPSGKVTVKLEYIAKGLKPGGTLNDGATVKLFVNGASAGEGTVGTAMLRHGIEPFEVGHDSISPVGPDYRDKGDFAFTGTIDKITFEANRQASEPPPRNCRRAIDPPVRPARACRISREHRVGRVVATSRIGCVHPGTCARRCNRSAGTCELPQEHLETLDCWNRSRT
jgi:arylsulfatase